MLVGDALPSEMCRVRTGTQVSDDGARSACGLANAEPIPSPSPFSNVDRQLGKKALARANPISMRSCSPLHHGLYTAGTRCDRRISRPTNGPICGAIILCESHELHDVAISHSGSPPRTTSSRRSWAEFRSGLSIRLPKPEGHRSTPFSRLTGSAGEDPRRPLRAAPGDLRGTLQTPGSSREEEMLKFGSFPPLVNCAVGALRGKCLHRFPSGSGDHSGCLSSCVRSGIPAPHRARRLQRAAVPGRLAVCEGRIPWQESSSLGIAT